MSFLTPEEKKEMADSTQSNRQKWYAKRKLVLEKALQVKKDDLLREILVVLLKIYYQIKK